MQRFSPEYIPEPNSSVFHFTTAHAHFYFDVPGGEDVTCACGHLLVKNCHRDTIFDIYFKCVSCGGFTYFPDLKPGDPLDCRVLLAPPSQMLIESPIGGPSIVLRSKRAADLGITDVGPSVSTRPFGMSNEYLDGLCLEYDALSGGRLEYQIRQVAKGKKDSIYDFSFAWAVSKLRACIQAEIFDLRDVATAIAFDWLRLFNAHCLAWGQHPRFKAIMAELSDGGSFLHTMGIFSTLGYLWSNDGPATFGTTDHLPNVKIPDLYLRDIGGGPKIHFEIKAPRALQWNGSAGHDPVKVRKGLYGALHNLRQLGAATPGALVIVSSWPGREFQTFLSTCAEEVILSKGRDKKHVAAILVVSPIRGELQITPEGIQLEFGHHFSPYLNPYFEGPNPLKVQRGNHV